MSNHKNQHDAVTEADALLARTIITALMPVRRRFPSLSDNPAHTTAAARTAAYAALCKVYGMVTVGEAAAAYQGLARFLGSEHGDKPGDGTMQEQCLYWVWRSLYEFISYAPAATADDAAARPRLLAWEITRHNGGGNFVALHAIAADFARLSTGAPVPAQATLAGWCAGV